MQLFVSNEALENVHLISLLRPTAETKTDRECALCVERVKLGKKTL